MAHLSSALTWELSRSNVEGRGSKAIKAIINQRLRPVTFTGWFFFYRFLIEKGIFVAVGWQMEVSIQYKIHP